LFSFFFFFHLQTKAFFFNNSVMFGGAKYRATGRGFVLSRDSFTRIYRTYARSHIYPAIKLLFMMVVFGIFNNTGTNWFFEMWAPLLLVIAWLYSPMWSVEQQTQCAGPTVRCELCVGHSCPACSLTLPLPLDRLLFVLSAGSILWRSTTTR